MADEKTALLTQSDRHRDHPHTAAQQRLKWSGGRSWSSACGSCALATASLPLRLFQRRKTDEVGVRELAVSLFRALSASSGYLLLLTGSTADMSGISSRHGQYLEVSSHSRNAR